MNCDVEYVEWNVMREVGNTFIEVMVVLDDQFIELLGSSSNSFSR